MRYLGVDLGKRRIGLALSDAAGLLARPWQTVEAGRTPSESARRVAGLAADHLRTHDEPDLAGIVIGLPRRLNGDDTDLTTTARQFAAALSESTVVPIHLQDERLTSREAEARLATREPDWRKRKRQIDATAAAIILQDYLDGQSRPAADGADGRIEDAED